MYFGLAFEPLVSLPVLTGAAVAALLVVALLLFSRSRGALIRALALGLAVLALANPSLTREERVTLIRAVDLGGQYYSRRNVGDSPFTGMEYEP